MTDVNTSAQKINIADYIQSLDGIRGLSCFFVILIHFKFSTVNLPSSIGYSALHCFFIMSAFLITKNLIKDKERSENFWECFKIFYIKRTARIFPVYYLYLFLVFGLVLFLKFVFHIDPFQTVHELKHYGWMLLTFFYNLKMDLVLHSAGQVYYRGILFPHLWSMALEEQFYFVIIFLVWFCSVRTLRIVSILFIILIPVVRIIGYLKMGQQTNDELLRTIILLQSPQYQFDAFFYGIAIAIFDIKKSKWLLSVFFISLVLIISFNIVNAVLCAHQSHVSILTSLRGDEYIYKNYGFVFLDTLVNIFCCAWILSAVYYPDKFSIFNNRILVRFGELTYCLYIFQFVSLMIGLVMVVLLHNKLHLPLVLAELIAFCIYIGFNYYLSGYVNRKVEIPFLAYKDRYLKKLSKQKKEKALK